VAQPDDSMRAVCPHCGAPVKGNLRGACKACGKPLEQSSGVANAGLESGTTSAKGKKRADRSAEVITDRPEVVLPTLDGRGGTSRLALAPALIALLALLIALTTVLTITVRIPIPVTQGYFNLSDAAITFAALVFGPLVGGVAGGVGAALADLLGGFPQFAALSLLAHGTEGVLIGWIGGRRRSLPTMILAWAAGGLAMVSLYFLGEGALLTSWPAAIAEIPSNVGQAVVGAITGIALTIAVRRAYPPIDQIGRPAKWREQ
jgi:uncharacterized membrane protein